MNIFQDNVQKNQEKISKLAKALNRLSLLRLGAFVFILALTAVLVSKGLSNLLLIFIPICVFGFVLLVNGYNKNVYLKKNATFLKEINEAELSRSENKLSGFATGESFIDREHPYISDLDIFGPHSLFQLLNRTTTDSGHILLAKWLSKPGSIETITKRQNAISELAPKISWRQNFQASGMHFKNSGKNYNNILSFVEKPVQLLPRQRYYLMFCIPLSILSTLSAIYFVFHLFSTAPEIVHSSIVSTLIPLLVILAINALILRKVKPIVEELTTNIYENIKVLGGYLSLTKNIESGQFDSELLQQLQSSLGRNNDSASKAIGRLKLTLEILQNRGTKGVLIGKNFFYTVLNSFWLLDVYLIILIETWKQKYGSRFSTWASSISEFEVLSSLAGFSYSNPTFAFPEIKNESYSIHFEMLGHPLVSKEKRVHNDFQLNGRGEIAMVTGSNMAGKSTFLRTVGINLVLAYMGAPCCAPSAQVSIIKVFTSMRTQDNLKEGISSFYAELKRIEQLLTLIAGGQAILFLLDEIFKGTNSQDRYRGGVSLIKQLSELNAFGMISTHDLELAQLAGTHLMVANYSFNSQIQEDQMNFDYKLSKGICSDFNASELMRKSGIKILASNEGLAKS